MGLENVCKTGRFFGPHAKDNVKKKYFAELVFSIIKLL